jgi:hypothetical protein
MPSGNCTDTRSTHLGAKFRMRYRENITTGCESLHNETKSMYWSSSFALTKSTTDAKP